MFPIPQIQIHQQQALLGVKYNRGIQELQQPRPEMQLKLERPELQIHSPNGELTINQQRAWDALGQGSHLETMQRIYSSSKEIALQGIARIVQEGRNLADLTNDKNVVASNAANSFFRQPSSVQLTGPASCDNVDLDYVAHAPEIEVIPGKVDLQVQVNRPIHKYTPSKVDIYMIQRGRVDITPPQMNLTL